ncbi:hypothetical protein ACX3VU_23955 [Escherichia coli]
MGELVISGGSGGFLRDIGTEYQEAAKNFMQFMNEVLAVFCAILAPNTRKLQKTLCSS